MSMVIEPSMLIIIGIIYTGLSITDRVITLLHRKGVFTKILRKLGKKKELLEESIKSNKSIKDDDSLMSTIHEIKNEVIQILPPHELLNLISISNLEAVKE